MGEPMRRPTYAIIELESAPEARLELERGNPGDGAVGRVGLLRRECQEWCVTNLEKISMFTSLGIAIGSIAPSIYFGSDKKSLQEVTFNRIIQPEVLVDSTKCFFLPF